MRCPTVAEALATLNQGPVDGAVAEGGGIGKRLMDPATQTYLKARAEFESLQVELATVAHHLAEMARSLRADPLRAKNAPALENLKGATEIKEILPQYEAAYHAMMDAWDAWAAMPEDKRRSNEQPLISTTESKDRGPDALRRW